MSELPRSVRVLSYEQITPLDRRWSSKPGAATRLPNLVIAYPSSLLGRDDGGGRARPAPWELERLHKPVLVFSAFGVLSNATSRQGLQGQSQGQSPQPSGATDGRVLATDGTAPGGGGDAAAASGRAHGDTPATLRSLFGRACSPSEARLIAQSSCYGKTCRFALRAVIAHQLEAARLPRRERAREQRCLRGTNVEAQTCPEVMSLTFWSPHDGGDGYKKLSEQPHRPPKGGPLFVDDREANDVLAIYRVMLASTFCLHIGGDTPTRKSFIDAILAACIPVVFQNDSVFTDSLPYADAIPYHQLMLHVPLVDELLAGGGGRLMEHLRAVPRPLVAAKQRLLRRYAPLLRYPYPKLRQPTLDVDVRTKPPRGEAGAAGLWARPNAVTLAIERLARDVAPLEE